MALLTEPHALQLTASCPWREWQ